MYTVSALWELELILFFTEYQWHVQWGCDHWKPCVIRARRTGEQKSAPKRTKCWEATSDCPAPVKWRLVLVLCGRKLESIVWYSLYFVYNIIIMYSNKIHLSDQTSWTIATRHTLKLVAHCYLVHACALKVLLNNSWFQINSHAHCVRGESWVGGAAELASFPGLPNIIHTASDDSCGGEAWERGYCGASSLIFCNCWLFLWFISPWMFQWRCNLW